MSRFLPASRARTAIVLAAGLGRRLEAAHATGPKGFVELGGEPIIARSARVLARAGIEEFVFVVGHRADAYERWLAQAGLPARCIVNPDYAVTGSLTSLRLGVEALAGGDAVVVESDLLYEQRAADAVAHATSDVVLASGFTGSGDEVWVYADEAGRLDYLTKVPRERGRPLGELVGLSRFSASTLAALAAAAAILPADAHYEDGLNAVAAARPISVKLLPDLVWCEIDDPGHLRRAREQIWPRIRTADSNSVSVT